MSGHDQKLQVLFVDDEADILAGLRLSLRKERRRWDMHFALDAQEALAILANEPIDVLCTDIQMPGMDGSELLARVRELHPHVIRIVISGHADDQVALRAISVAHRFLIKPAERSQIVEAIEGTHSELQTISSAELRGLVASVACLPTHQPQCDALLALSAESDCDAAVACGLVEQDPALAAKLLQMSNSSYFSGSKTVVSVRSAVTTFAAASDRSPAVQAHSFLVEPCSDSFERFDLIQKRSTLTARIASQIASEMNLDKEAAETAGLLSEIGLWLLESCAPALAAEANGKATEDDCGLPDAQRALFGTDHAALGAVLLSVWGLPDALVEPVRLQYATREPGCCVLDLAGVVHLARYLAQQASTELAGQHDFPAHPLDFAYVNATGLSAKLQVWGEFSRAQAEQIFDERDSKAA